VADNDPRRWRTVITIYAESFEGLREAAYKVGRVIGSATNFNDIACVACDELDPWQVCSPGYWFTTTCPALERIQQLRAEADELEAELSRETNHGPD
jgi:hypothetical protein